MSKTTKPIIKTKHNIRIMKLYIVLWIIVLLLLAYLWLDAQWSERLRLY